MRLALASAITIGALGAACGGPQDAPVGVSARAPSRPASADAGAVTPRGAELAILPRDFRTRYAKLSATRFVSAGHASGRFEVEVYGNELAKDGMGKNVGEYARGTVFVKEHWERTPEGLKTGPLMAMEKMAPGYDSAHGDWRYVVVGADGELLTDGKPDGCVLCHDDAPRDRVFVVK